MKDILIKKYDNYIVIVLQSERSKKQAIKDGYDPRYELWIFKPQLYEIINWCNLHNFTYEYNSPDVIKLSSGLTFKKK